MSKRNWLGVAVLVFIGIVGVASGLSAIAHAACNPLPGFPNSCNTNPNSWGTNCQSQCDPSANGPSGFQNDVSCSSQTALPAPTTDPSGRTCAWSCANQLTPVCQALPYGTCGTQQNVGRWNLTEVSTPTQSCTGGTPLTPGATCTSNPNNCNQTTSGIVQPDGTCNAVAPSNSSCPSPNSCLTSWQYCGAEGSSCSVPSETNVRFGDPNSNSFDYKGQVTGSIACSVTAFGGTDPAYGVQKQCDYCAPMSVSISANPSGSMTAPGATTISWTTIGSPDSCTASGAWSGAQNPAGGSVTESNLAASATPYTFTITCNKAGLTPVSSQVTITVNPPAYSDKPPVGNLDGADCSTIYGWAYDPDDSGDTMFVKLYENGPENSAQSTYLGEIQTDISRGDVNNYFNVSGSHGFVYATPSGAKTIYAYGVDNQTGADTPLSSSPATVSCGSPTVALSGSIDGGTTYSHGPISAVAGQPIYFKWNSTNIPPQGCSFTYPGGVNYNSSDSGTQYGYVPIGTTMYPISCKGYDGSTVQDLVEVDAGNVPDVHIDSPFDGATINPVVTGNSVAINGWALDNITVIGSPIDPNSLKMYIDGVLSPSPVLYGAAAGALGNRLDVCAAHPGRAGCPNVGFITTWNIAGVPPGPHIIRIAAANTDPTPQVGSTQITVNLLSGNGPTGPTPNPPGGASASLTGDTACGTDQILLSWTAPTSGQAPDSYRIFRATTNSFAAALQAATVATLSYTDSPTPGIKQFYWVESVYQGQASGQIPANTNASGGIAAVACGNPPPTPSVSLSATSGGYVNSTGPITGTVGDPINFTWAASNGASGCTFTYPGGTVSKDNESNFPDPAGIQSGTYIYKVACNGGAVSATVSVTGNLNTSGNGTNIRILPSSFTFTPAFGTNPPNQYLTLYDTGSTDINWSLANAKPWLSEDKTSGTLISGQQIQITVKVNSALEPKNYSDNDNINVTWAVGQTTPVPVSLTVGGGSAPPPGGWNPPNNTVSASGACNDVGGVNNAIYVSWPAATPAPIGLNSGYQIIRNSINSPFAGWPVAFVQGLSLIDNTLYQTPPAPGYWYFVETTNDGTTMSSPIGTAGPVAASSCGTSTGGPTGPSCSFFSANPASVTPPQNTTLTWDCQNVDSCAINGASMVANEIVQANGSITGSDSVAPTKNNNTYTLDCNKINGGSVQVVRTVGVTGAGTVEIGPP
jgi:hypothetical protein